VPLGKSLPASYVAGESPRNLVVALWTASTGTSRGIRRRRVATPPHARFPRLDSLVYRRARRLRAVLTSPGSHRR
jgi:hypothetical protein